MSTKRSHILKQTCSWTHKIYFGTTSNKCHGRENIQFTEAIQKLFTIDDEAK